MHYNYTRRISRGIGFHCNLYGWSIHSHFLKKRYPNLIPRKFISVEQEHIPHVFSFGNDTWIFGMMNTGEFAGLTNGNK